MKDETVLTPAADSENTVPQASSSEALQGTQEKAAEAAAPLSEEDQLRVQVKKLEEELAVAKDKVLRAHAEVENHRMRAKRETEEAKLYALQKFAADIVEAAENMRRALNSLPKAEENDLPIIQQLREGLSAMERSFTATLEKNGIKSEDPTGKKFDPEKHQAMAEQEHEEAEPGTVLHSWGTGWTLNGRLIRPAMVVVAKAKKAASDDEEKTKAGKN